MNDLFRNRPHRSILCLIFLTGFCGVASTKEQTAADIGKEAARLIEKGDYENALSLFEKLLTINDVSRHVIVYYPETLAKDGIENVFFYIGTCYARLSEDKKYVARKEDMQLRALIAYDHHARRQRVMSPLKRRSDSEGRFDVLPVKYAGILLFCWRACLRDKELLSWLAPALHGAFHPFAISPDEKFVVLIQKTGDPHPTFVGVAENGERKWLEFSSPYSSTNIPSEVVLHDTDGDGTPEIVLVWRGMFRRLLDKDGHEAGSEEYDAATVLRVQDGKIILLKEMADLKEIVPTVKAQPVPHQ